MASVLAKTKTDLIDANKTLSGNLKKASIDSIVTPKLINQALSTYKGELTSLKEKINGLAEVSEENKLVVISDIERMEKLIDDFYESEKRVAEFTNELVSIKLPYFILFSSFDRPFPKSIEIANLANDEWAKDLEQVSAFKISKILSSSDQERRNHQESVNAEFTDKFKQFWTQDDIKLQVEKEGQNINFWIVENGKQYYPTQRSKGQQWYLSFYIKIVARLKEDKPNIILIDEPGLYLHAKAQKDLLSVLAEHGSDYPVVFSTHSPYLIKEENLENIRLVEKNNNSTIILGKIHKHSLADKETLTPILTAIGLGVNDSITNITQRDNVVVEGPEDVFYLQAFKKMHNENLNVNFINGGGSGNMGLVGAILEGWGADVYYLYDNDKGKEDGSKKLNDWRVLPEMIKVVLKETGKTIADILSVNDFKKFVLENADLKYTSFNSEYIKNKKLDKVLLARKFLQKVKMEQVLLDQESKNNVENLFKEINFCNEKESATK